MIQKKGMQNKGKKISLSDLQQQIQLFSSTTTRSDGGIASITALAIKNSVKRKRGEDQKCSPKQTSASTNNKKQHNNTPEAFKSSGINPEYTKLGSPNHKCRFCNATMWFEERSGTSSSENTTFSTCCQEGKVLLSKLKQPPEPLRTLIKDRGRYGTKFRKNIRKYNSMFGFTSFGARIDDKINESRGPYTFRVSGQNYHRIGSLLPEDGKQPRFAQLYFYDTENEVKNRMECMNLTPKDVDETVVQQLIGMLNDSSAVAKAFRMARDWTINSGDHNVALKLIAERKAESRMYNAPTVTEIAGLVIGDFGAAGTNKDIIIQPKNGGLQRISELHPQYMALQYPLAFPHGEDGFHMGIPYQNNSGKRKTNRGTVTMKEYYSYRIQQRLTESTLLIECERLFHQYVVDAFTSVEEQRLSWVRYHQTELRADLYNNICDAVNRGDTDAKAVGKRIILPATFVGGPRYMMQNYQDAMAICRAFGNPTLFITFTANPKWPEVQEMLAELPGQTANDRPDVMSRLFRLKLAQLMKDLRKREIFGPTKAAVYTIEFQKRGLPHAHILLWLDRKGEGTSEEDINDVISAEIPPITSNPDLRKLVTEHMLHGPCGKDNINAPCTSNASCTKHFPRPFYSSTTVDEDGYPVYRRRDNGDFVTKGKAKMDNRHVVPYNPYLLQKYKAHINVEWCNQSRAIKYLFKYISKGPDRATIMLLRSTVRPGERIDEITEYLECRYISACEATWRILGFDIHYSNPSVIRLPLHLPDQNSVTCRDTQSLESVLKQEGVNKTMLTEWFTLNSVDERARQMTYAEIPQKYVWHDKEKEWRWRKQQKPIGRIVYCHPASGERYYLRLLLNYVKGPQKYEDIMTVEGVVYSSFRTACYARGLLNDDKEWSEAIQESRLWATGPQLRELFVTILIFCEVTSPLNLWDRSWEALSEDILYQKRKLFRFPSMTLTEHQIKNYALTAVADILATHGKSLADFPDLPTPDNALLQKSENRLIREEMSYNVPSLADEHYHLLRCLNPKQLEIYNHVVKSATEGEGDFLFVHGAGGTGKTFLYRTILAKVRSDGNIALAVASSGIAALLLPGGRTAHSRFLIPLDLQEHSTCGIKQNTQLAHLLRETKLIIWDEAPMTQRFAFEALNRTLQDIRGMDAESNRRRIFGGVTMVLGGDFRQILPVITKGKRQEIVQSCINNSHLWRECQVIQLTTSMRVNDKKQDGTTDETNKQFNKWILAVGDGNANAIALEPGEEPNWITVGQKYIVQPQNDTIQQAIDVVYADFAVQKNKASYLQERAILTPLNEDADKINAEMFNRMEGKEKTYKSSDEVCLASTDTEDQESMYPTEFLNGLEFPGMPPHILRLKEGLPVMILRNVNPNQGLCNGTRMLITRLGAWVVEAEIITGSHIGRKVVIPRISMTTTNSKWPFVLKRRQFPLKMCFAMTINKSQGQSLKHVCLFLPKPVFCHGQLYVAISRVTDPKGLKVLMSNKQGQPRDMTKNIVFKEAFKNLANNYQEHTDNTKASSDELLNSGIEDKQEEPSEHCI